MKKIIPLAICIFCITKFSVAQSVHAGIKTGADLYKISGVPFSNKFTFGYHAGAFAEIKFNKKYGIQPEVLFNSVNADTAQSFSTLYGFNSIKKVNFKYLSLPILFTYKLAPFLKLQAGPQFGILLNKSESLLKNGENAFRQGSLAFAGGLQFNFKKIKVYGRYVAGINDVNNTKENVKWHNQTIQAGVGLRLF